MPFDGPVAQRALATDGQYILNPTKTELATSKLDLVVAGTETAVLMVESEAHELAKTSCSVPWCLATRRKAASTPSSNWPTKAAKFRGTGPAAPPQVYLIDGINGMAANDINEAFRIKPNPAFRKARRNPPIALWPH